MQEFQQPEPAVHVMIPTTAAATGSACTATVPERPALAPGVELAGKLHDSAFAASQWLVQRNGHFIQLTALLYQIATLANGERTLEEIATAVTDATSRHISANNVQYLIANRLIPTGLIAGAEGTPGIVAEEGEIRSPLKINMRKRVFGPRLINPVTCVLQYLYFPPIVFFVLLITIATQYWAFVMHGLSGAIHQTVVQPELLLELGVLGLFIGPIHEFGHAAALRYGGGKVRWIGIGFYLIYPVLYTDVTDSYRLSRWSRVRTDLGGFYFTLIYSLGVTAFYAYTRWDYLLLFLLFVDLDILDEFVPFVRFDGYWVFADLTGLPDFLSLIGPFLRSILPLHRWKGRRLPPLKRWVKVAFAFYIVITVPVLVLLLFLMVALTPNVLALAWQSLMLQINHWPAIQQAGEPLTIALLILRIVIIGMPVFGTLLTLYLLGRTTFHLLLKMGRSSVKRRILAIACATCLVALLALFWVVQVSALIGIDPLQGLHASHVADVRVSLVLPVPSASQ
jgi:putative peptide zinc metalloprotease protein